MLEKVTAGVGNDDGPGDNFLPSAAALSTTKEEVWNVVSGPYVPLGYGVSYCNQSAQIHPAWKRQIKGDLSPNVSLTVYKFHIRILMTCQTVHVVHIRAIRRVVLLLQGQ